LYFKARPAATVMAVLLLVIGVVLFGKGLGGLQVRRAVRLGLYAAPAAPILCAALGSSRQSIVGPMAAFSRTLVSMIRPPKSGCHVYISTSYRTKPST
jgi:hypothetical protein